MKLGIVVYSNDPETVWNAFRFANFALAMGDGVKAFLMGKGVEVESLDADKFKVSEQLQTFLDSGGKLFACGTCLDIRGLSVPETFKVSTLKDMLDIVRDSDRLLTF